MNLVVYSGGQTRKYYFFIITILSGLIISSTTIVNGFTNVVFSQTETDQVSSNDTTNLMTLQDIPLKKIGVGDIEIAYKMFGKGDPIILHNGASDTMNAWDPSLLTRLASNNTVIVFDSRGIGNTAAGTEPYSIQLLANDTNGLLDGLKIREANILGYSLGTFVAQQFAINYPEKVSSLILIAGSCGGKDGIPKPHAFQQLQTDIANKTTNNDTVTNDELKALVTASLGSGWVKLYPESVDMPENISLAQMKPGLPPQTMNNQANVGWDWEAQDWNGVCDDLAKIAKPTLIITGTDDNAYMPHENALIIASKVPGAWLIQIKNAGHAVVDQYPDKVGNIIETFLYTVK